MYTDAHARRLRAACPRTPRIIDLSHEPDMATVDFARLVVLRRRLLLAGQDLRLIGLRGRSKSTYQITHLQNALPCDESAEAG